LLLTAPHLSRCQAEEARVGGQALLSACRPGCDAVWVTAVAVSVHEAGVVIAGLAVRSGHGDCLAVRTNGLHDDPNPAMTVQVRDRDKVMEPDRTQARPMREFCMRWPGWAATTTAPSVSGLT
jgi:hypothetical protein